MSVFENVWVDEEGFFLRIIKVPGGGLQVIYDMGHRGPFNAYEAFVEAGGRRVDSITVNLTDVGRTIQGTIATRRLPSAGRETIIRWDNGQLWRVNSGKPARWALR
jgi:hypothetical protein